MSVVLEEASVGASVTYHPSYLDKSEADRLLGWMLANAPWQVEAPVVFGKAREVRRRTCAYGAEGLVYRYSGVDRAAVAWPAHLMVVVERLRRDFGCRFNFGLCNLYVDGDAYIGRHADDERDIAPDSPIVGLSLGAARDFVLYRRAGGQVARVALEHGSVIAMRGSTQRHFQHAVPKRKRVREPRVNVTFRQLVDLRGDR